MRYGRDENVGCSEPVKCGSEPIESMAELMHDAAAVGRDILKMAETLSVNLFGLCPRISEEKEASPGCFRDELAAHRKCLARAAEELSRICSVLGM